MSAAVGRATTVLEVVPPLLSRRWTKPRAHHVFKVGGGDAGAAELQLGDEALEKDAALFYR